MAFFSTKLALPLLLLMVALFWSHLHLTPKILSKSHYQVLGVKPDDTSEAITYAYKQLSASWSQPKDYCTVPRQIFEIQHAYTILSDPLRKRDYDNFGIDELKDVVSNVDKDCAKATPEIDLLWNFSFHGPLESQTRSLTNQNYRNFFGGPKATVIQIYSVASRNSHIYSPVWEEIASHLDGVANSGRIELGEIPLVAALAQKNQATGFPVFRQGLPSIVAFPPNCGSFSCLVRYSGKITTDSVVDWVSTRILQLPQILYYSSQTLVTNLIQKSGPHKVKVVIFSRTGERAAPFLREAAKVYWQYAAFGVVLWREEDASLWRNMFGIDAAPAFLVLKDPGVEPVIHYGYMNSSTFRTFMEEHKTHVLPQLRSITAAELGCDEAGYSRAGREVSTWYCILVAGRLSLELSQMRHVLREVQSNLRKEVASKELKGEPMHNYSTAALTFRFNRLTLAWLDGDTQKQICYFYLHSETVYETCGPKRSQEINDVPKIFLIRYKRDPNEKVKLARNMKPVNFFWNKVLGDEENLASQIVARYSGSTETSEIINWISEMIKEGDYKDLPFYDRRAPALIPEETKPAWLGDIGSYTSRSREAVMYKVQNIRHGLLDHVKDTNIAPLLAVIIILYITGIFFRSNMSNWQHRPASEKPTRTGKI